MQCVRSASETYEVPRIVLLGILKTEGGRSGLESKNKNGTVDYGIAQINTRWMKELKKHGVHNPVPLVRDNDCYNIHVSAWILKRELGDTDMHHPDFWRRAANYHSRTRHHNVKYQSLLYRSILAISKTRWN